MKRPYCMMLALALAGSLAACGGPGASAPSATAAPEAAATAETAPAEETPAPAGDFYTLTNGPFNTGDACYVLDPHIGYCLVTKIDYATAEQQVLCSVPGCPHDSDACPAYVPGRGTEVALFTAGDKVYVYHSIATMHYEGSWEDYEAEVVRNHWEEKVAQAAQEGMTEEELLAFYRGRYVEQSAPAGLFIIDGDGASRREVTCTRDIGPSALRWCDGVALYGAETEQSSASVGYRVSLADGSVTTFPLQPYEWVMGAWKNRLLTCRVLTEMPLPDPADSWDVYSAVLQNAVVEYDWLDPATGERSKILERPYDGSTYGNGDFCGVQDGKLCFEDRTVLENGGYQRNGYYLYDPATGRRQDLVRPLENESMQLSPVLTGAPPETAALQGRYLWFHGSSGNYGGDDLLWALDRQTGELTAIRQKADGAPWPVQVLALAGDGRFLVNTAAEGTAYALIDADAFLQGSTDYTPVKMLA